MRIFRMIVFAIFAVLLCLSACSRGGDDPIEPTPKPEVTKSEITIDSNIITNGLSFLSYKGEQSISFSTNENWTLNIANTTSGVTWCTVSATSGAKGNANVKFNVTENTDYENRSVSVTIKSGTVSKTFTISQKSADALLVTTDKYEVNQNGGTIEIEVKTNIDYKMEISESAMKWISESSSRGLTTYKHTLKIAANEEIKKREGEIHFKSGNKVETIKIYQAASEAILLLSQNEYNVSNKGDTISVDVKSNVEYDVQMPKVDWIIDMSSNRGLSSHTLNYIVRSNETYDNRYAEIIFYDKNNGLKDTLKVVQMQKDAIVITKKRFEVQAEGETIEVEFLANIDFEIIMPKADWINLLKSRTLNSAKCYFKIEENLSNEKRCERIIIKNQKKQLYDTIIVEQTSIKKETPYLTFSANEKQTLKMSKTVKTLEFSVNGDEWKELETTTVYFGGELGKLRLRGNNLYGTGGANFMFGNETPVACSGDIRTLLNYEKYYTVNTEDAKFSYLFKDCSSLTSAPELPSKNLASSCYSHMFHNCTSLTHAPELPAISLRGWCYESMFEGCINLIETPDLPATNIARSCYASMFKNCTGLLKTSDLPATTLEEQSYKEMFYGCTNLVQTPKIFATNLAKECCQYMFHNCTSLLQASELPAKVLKETCYQGMFYSCTSLTKAPELPATTLDTYCYSVMFVGCTSLKEAPKLPATTLATGCYAGMFNNCSSLTKAPELPATTLYRFCYNYMFQNCTSLTQMPELPAMNLAHYCYYYMFSGCTNLTQISKLPATNLAQHCYSGMFSGCTSLTKAPDLPATDLSTESYSYMFYECKQLNSITMLATNISYNNCLNNWLEGVSSVGTFTKAPKMDSLPNGYSGIPNGWTIKNYGEE